MEKKIVGYGLVGVSVLHLALGTNDPLSSFWTALTSSIEIAVLLLGLWILFASHFKSAFA